MSLLGGQVKLQLLQGFNHLLLVLGFGRLLTAAGVTCTGQTRRRVLLQDSGAEL